MKPLNLDNRPCSPISSNCVIWQGPDIPCIKLCSGDTVSDVVAALGTELCEIMNQLDVSTYDLSCLDLTGCAPSDFHGLIQLLITKICEANGITPDSKSNPSGCPDCVVSVAPCFVQGTQTTMQLVDYVQMIANRICSILDQIDIINNQISSLDSRVTVLENTPPPTFTLPSIDTGCLTSYIPGTPASATIDIVLDTLLNNSTIGYCALVQATGLPANLLSAVASQCIAATDNSLSFPGQTMGTAYFGSWVNTPTTVADAITNLWLSVCDIYSSLNLPIDVTGADTETVEVSVTAGPNYVVTADLVDTGWVDLLGFGYYGAGTTKPQCRRIGKQIHFRGSVTVPLENPAAPGTVVTLTSTSYNSIMGVTPFSGAPDGVTVDPNGAVRFNNTTNVIPTSVLPAVTNLDGGYKKSFEVGARAIDLDATYGASLTSVVTVGITSAKILYIAVLKDNELTNTRAAGLLGASAMRYITSNVRAGEVIPNYTHQDTDIHNLPAAGTQPLVADSEFINQSTMAPVASVTWPISCNAGLETQIGGFSFNLDGLIAYI